MSRDEINTMGTVKRVAEQLGNAEELVLQAHYCAHRRAYVVRYLDAEQELATATSKNLHDALRAAVVTLATTKDQAARWVRWEHDQCDYCGGDAEVLTSAKNGYAYDGDQARCTECGLPGGITCDSESPAVVMWHDEPGCECEWCQGAAKVSQEAAPVCSALPCPHCGAPATKKRYHGDRSRIFYACSRDECVVTCSEKDEAVAVAKWNQRWPNVPDQATRGRDKA